MCGSGTFTQDDAHAACMNVGSGPKDCEAITIGSGNWQAWCEPAKMNIYFWAEIDGVEQTAPGGCIPWFLGGAYQIPGAGVGSAGTPHQVQFPEVSPNVSYEYMVHFSVPTASGSGILASSALIAVVESGSICTFPVPNAVKVSGFNVAWQ